MYKLFQAFGMKWHKAATVIVKHDSLVDRLIWLNKVVELSSEKEVVCLIFDSLV